MESQLGFIWSIEYPILGAWSHSLTKKYFTSEEKANEFTKVNGLSNSKIERCLGLQVGTEFFSLGSSIKFE